VRSVLLATCSALPGGDDDGDALLAALCAAGVSGRFVAWDDASVDWTSAPVVIRSTWDYTLRHAEFLAWTRSVPALFNPADVVAWSADKIYLRELAADGVPIVPTTWLAPGEDVPTFDTEVVVKPSLGSGARGIGRFGAGDHEGVRAQVAHLHGAGRTAMVQPYLRRVDGAGEATLVYLDGRFSHAVTKSALLSSAVARGVSAEPLPVTGKIVRREPSTAELRIGSQVQDVLRARFGAPLLYTRVDLMPGPDGPVLGELELAEPRLFLSHDDTAPARFAAAIAARA